jgi:predicted CoA-binding protein
MSVSNPRSRTPSEEAGRIAEEAGMTVVMDDCIKRAVWRLLPPAR